MGRWLDAARTVASPQEKSRSATKHELTKLTEPGFVGFVGSDFTENAKFFRVSDPAAEIQERAGMAAEGIPSAYLDAWANFQCAPSRLTSADAWQQAIEDAGLLLDHWGERLAEYDWPSASIFGLGGLAWHIQGEVVSAVGPEHAIIAGDRIFDRREVSRDA